MFADVNEAYAERTSRPTRPRARRSASPRSRSAPRSRSTRIRCASPTDADVKAARAGGARTIARRTPMLSSRTISERAGGEVVLKAENLQRTGSFKVRGVAAKLAALGEEGCAPGWSRAVGGQPRAGARRRRAAARRARARCSCPTTRRSRRSRRRAAQGATIHVGGDSVDECLQRRAASAPRRAACAFVHPFDDPDVVAGQGDARARAARGRARPRRVVVPVGGGGLCAGVGDRGQAGAARRSR